MLESKVVIVTSFPVKVVQYRTQATAVYMQMRNLIF